jgi:hypothetical protein
MLNVDNLKIILPITERSTGCLHIERKPPSIDAIMDSINIALLPIPGNRCSDGPLPVRLYNDPVLRQLLLDKNNFFNSFNNEVATCPKETRAASPPSFLSQCD